MNGYFIKNVMKTISQDPTYYCATIGILVARGSWRREIFCRQITYAHTG